MRESSALLYRPVGGISTGRPAISGERGKTKLFIDSRKFSFGYFVVSYESISLGDPVYYVLAFT
jgi:hypothetical protein